MDPIEEQGGSNLYAYAGNLPVNTVDYLGLLSVQFSQVQFANGNSDGAASYYFLVEYIPGTQGDGKILAHLDFQITYQKCDDCKVVSDNFSYQEWFVYRNGKMITTGATNKGTATVDTHRISPKGNLCIFQLGAKIKYGIAKTWDRSIGGIFIFGLANSNTWSGGKGEFSKGWTPNQGYTIDNQISLGSNPAQEWEFSYIFAKNDCCGRSGSDDPIDAVYIHPTGLGF